MWGRVLLRAWGHFASPRERNRRVCWWPVLSRLRLQRGKKSRGPQLYVLHCNGYTHATSPQFAAVSCAVSPNRRPHLQHFLALPCSFCSPSLVWFWPRQGAESPQPVDGITGYMCPPGTYCPAGSSSPLGCPPGKYNPSEAMEDCEDCLPGFVCPGNTTFPEECPVYHYCPPGSATGTTCPIGTFGSRVSVKLGRSAKENTPVFMG